MDKIAVVAAQNDRRQRLLRRWLSLAAHPGTPFFQRVLVFLSFLIIPIIAAAGHALFTWNARDLPERARHIGLLALAFLIFAAVWHIMSRRNR